MTIQEKYELAHRKFWEVAKKYCLEKPDNFEPIVNKKSVFSPEHSTIVIGCYDINDTWCSFCTLAEDCEEGGVFDKIFEECQEYFDELKEKI